MDTTGMNEENCRKEKEKIRYDAMQLYTLSSPRSTIKERTEGMTRKNKGEDEQGDQPPHSDVTHYQSDYTNCQINKTCGIYSAVLLS